MAHFINKILPIIDPVNFNLSAGLMSSYSYQTGLQSPMVVDNNDGEGHILALKPNDELSKLLTEKYKILNSTPKIWYGTDYYNDGRDPGLTNLYYPKFIVSKDHFEKYLTSFYKTYKDAISIRKKEIEDKNKTNKNQKQNTFADSVVDDDDIKLSLYRTFKSFTDKWISASEDGGLFYNMLNSSDGPYCGNNAAGPKKTLASHFHYVNRVMGDIGDIAVIDITKLNELLDNKKITLYQYVSDLLVDNEYLFFPLPTYINFTGKGVSDEDLKDMFRPSLLDIKDISCGPLFLCMYVGGTSRQLKLEQSISCPYDQEALSNIRNDSFNMDFNNPASIPAEIKDPTQYYSDGYTAFKILYGLQNQNHFKSIQLDQSDFSETAESLLVVDRLSQQGGNDKTSKGQNLNTAYLTRSYSCSVESLGNMMIQPMTYFDLQGVPMFSGAHLITEVKHNFKPNHATTTFKGVRQPRATVPIVTEAAIAMRIGFKRSSASYSVSNVLFANTPASCKDVLTPQDSTVTYRAKNTGFVWPLDNMKGSSGGGLGRTPKKSPNALPTATQGAGSDNHKGYDLISTKNRTDSAGNAFRDCVGGKGSNGCRVYSIGDGEVLYSEASTGFGPRFVTIQCVGKDGYYYLACYGHLPPNIFVNQGDKVKLGQQIAVMGNEGKSGGFHLHFELYRWNKPFPKGNASYAPSNSGVSKLSYFNNTKNKIVADYPQYAGVELLDPYDYLPVFQSNGGPIPDGEILVNSQLIE